MLDKKKLTRRAGRSEDIDPMSFVSNLSDAMLILAVGIMVALVAAWNVDITAVYEENNSVNPDNMVEITDELEDLYTTTDKTDDSLSPEDYGLQEVGKVFVDENGNFYVIEEEN